MRKHIREQLKPEIRQSIDEEEAWKKSQEVLEQRIKGFNEIYAKNVGIIRDFHRMRWELKGLSLSGSTVKERMNEFTSTHKLDEISEVREPIGIISQLLPLQK